MIAFVNKLWKELSEEQREELELVAVAIDATTCSPMTQAGECIVDFHGTKYSTFGVLNVEGEVEIKEYAPLYISTEGCDMFNLLDKKFGSITLADGVKFFLTQLPQLAGTLASPYYEAQAIDINHKEYRLKWRIEYESQNPWEWTSPYEIDIY